MFPLVHTKGEVTAVTRLPDQALLLCTKHSKKSYTVKTNVGKIDKVIRVIVALIAAYLYLGDILTGIWGYVALVVSFIMIVTAITGSCPLYSVFGFSSCPMKSKK